MAFEILAAEILDPYLELRQPVAVDKLQRRLGRFVRKATEISTPFHHRTNRGSTRLTFMGQGDSTTEITGFEVTGRKRKTEVYGIFQPRITSIRLIDAERASRPNIKGSWYQPMPTNVQFANGTNFPDTLDEDLWAIFETAATPTELAHIETTQVIEPETPQAVALGHIASHLQAVVKSL